MKKSLTTTLIVLAIVFGVLFWGFSWYTKTRNQMVEADQAWQKSFGDLQTALIRQAELIPNFMETVKGNAAFERGTFTDIASARSNVTAIQKIDPTKIANDPAMQKQLIDAQANVNNNLVRFNQVREAYPELKANEAFRSFMVQLEGSQNRVTVARGRTQIATERFNNLILRFPNSLVATGYAPKPYYQANDSAQSAPQVKF